VSGRLGTGTVAPEGGELPRPGDGDGQTGGRVSDAGIQLRWLRGTEEAQRPEAVVVGPSKPRAIPVGGSIRPSVALAPPLLAPWAVR
jgi:hypothetical protein